MRRWSATFQNGRPQFTPIACTRDSDRVPRRYQRPHGAKTMMQRPCGSREELVGAVSTPSAPPVRGATADAKNAGNRRRVPVSSRSVPVRASLVPAQDRARAGVAGIRGRRLGTSASGQEVRMALFSLLRATRLFNDANDWLEMGMNVPEVCGFLQHANYM